MDMNVKSMRLLNRFWEGRLGWRRTGFIRPAQASRFDPQSVNARTLLEYEQNRIARHLHDTLAHDLAFLCLKLDQLSSTTNLTGSPVLKSDIATLHGVAFNAYENMRSLLSDLREVASKGSTEEWISHVRESARLIAERGQLTVDFDAGDAPISLPPHMQNEVLYLIRELLRNIEKHAGAKNVKIILKEVEQALSITVADDGIGFEAASKQQLSVHHGLKIIQEIVDEYHGTFRLESGPQNGTHVQLWLPIVQPSH